MKLILGDALALSLMDTDSFVYFITGMNEKTYNEIILANPNLKSYLDFSKFSDDHPLYKKIIKVVVK